MDSVGNPSSGLSGGGRQVTFSSEIGTKSLDNSTSLRNITPDKDKTLQSSNSFFTSPTTVSAIQIEELVAVFSDENIAENSPRKIGKNFDEEKGTISDLLTYNEVRFGYD